MLIAGRLAVGVTLVIALLGSPALADEDRPNVDLSRAKELWHSLTPEERRAYDAAFDEAAHRRATAVAFGQSIQPITMAAEDTCERATDNSGSLADPGFLDSGDTSAVQANDDYRYGDQCGCSELDSRAPNCGGFNAKSGNGPDVAYKIAVDQECQVLATLTPTDNLISDQCRFDPAGGPMECPDDLALYITTLCDDDDIQEGCVGANDFGGAGVAETVPFLARTDRDYFVVVDGFSGSAGPFELNIKEDPSAPVGCSLVPVEVQTFTVD